MMNVFFKKLMLALSLSILTASAFAQTCNTSITATTAHLVDNNNGTVSDPRTGLIWKKCSEGQTYNTGNNSCDGSASGFNWQAALQQAQTVNAGSDNFSQIDWRVPNINELASIAELQCYSPAINETVFPSTPSSWYWSSSPYAGSSVSAWMFVFDYGYGSTYNKGYGNHVRLVRSGQ